MDIYSIIIGTSLILMFLAFTIAFHRQPTPLQLHNFYKEHYRQINLGYDEFEAAHSQTPLWQLKRIYR